MARRMSQQVFEPLLHQAFPKAIDPALLQACMDEFVPKFKPMKVIDPACLSLFFGNKWVTLG